MRIGSQLLSGTSRRDRKALEVQGLGTILHPTFLALGWFMAHNLLLIWALPSPTSIPLQLRGGAWRSVAVHGGRRRLETAQSYGPWRSIAANRGILGGSENHGAFPGPHRPELAVSYRGFHPGYRCPLQPFALHPDLHRHQLLQEEI